MAIVNEDISMVKFLLDHGVNYNQRCTGNFMSPEDQKASRVDSMSQEHVLNNPNTNYEGYITFCSFILYIITTPLFRSELELSNCIF